MSEDLSSYLVYFLAFLFVLVLILFAVWIFRSLTGSQGGNSGSSLFGGRDKRIGVVQATSLEGRRKLLLIRRDDKEHLIRIGGPVDMLIENGIDSPSARSIGSLRRDALYERPGMREPLAGDPDFDDFGTTSGDTGTAAFNEDDARPRARSQEDPGRTDTPRRRVSLTNRTDPPKSDDEP